VIILSESKLAIPKNNIVALDIILNWQMAIAWAGEANCQPTRLGWWRTDLIDNEGGGDLFARLFPRTKAYAGWESVRDAAIAVDRRARQRMATPDEIRTLFFWGFDIDEQLNDRLAQRKQRGEELVLPIAWKEEFDREILATQIRDCCGESKYRLVAGGREVNNSDTLEHNVLALVAAFVPWERDYPMPFCRANRSLSTT